MNAILTVLFAGTVAGLFAGGIMGLVLVFEILSGLLLRAIFPNYSESPERSFIHTNPPPKSNPPTLRVFLPPVGSHDTNPFDKEK